MFEILTAAKARELFSYNPLTGELTNRVTRNYNSMAGDLAGSYTSKGYRQVSVNGRKYLAHRVIFLMITGRWPDQIDHINHIRGDNRWVNLREASHIDNQRNRSLHKNNTSGVCGVSLDKDAQKWRPFIRVKNKLLHLGFYYDINDAIAARAAAEIKYGFHVNHGKLQTRSAAKKAGI